MPISDTFIVDLCNERGRILDVEAEKHPARSCRRGLAAKKQPLRTSTLDSSVSSLFPRSARQNSTRCRGGTRHFLSSDHIRFTEMRNWIRPFSLAQRTVLHACMQAPKP